MVVFGGILYVFIPVFLEELSSIITLFPGDSGGAGLLGGFSLKEFTGGDPAEIINGVFGGKSAYLTALKELEDKIKSIIPPTNDNVIKEVQKMRDDFLALRQNF